MKLSCRSCYEDDDHVTIRTLQQTLKPNQTSHTIITFQSEFQNQCPNDCFLSQDILTNMANYLTRNADEFFHTNAITQTHIKPTSTESLPYLTHPFLLIV